MPSPFAPQLVSRPKAEPLPRITSLGRRPVVRGIDVIKLAAIALGVVIAIGVAATRAVVAQLDAAGRDPRRSLIDTAKNQGDRR